MQEWDGPQPVHTLHVPRTKVLYCGRVNSWTRSLARRYVSQLQTHKEMWGQYETITTDVIPHAHNDIREVADLHHSECFAWLGCAQIAYMLLHRSHQWGSPSPPSTAGGGLCKSPASDYINIIQRYINAHADQAKRMASCAETAAKQNSGVQLLY